MTAGVFGAGAGILALSAFNVLQFYKAPKEF